MQFVIDDMEFIFSEEANFDNIERLEVLLDLLDDIWSDGWVTYYSEELFYKEVGWGRTLYELYADDAPLKIPRNVQERLGALFSRLPKCDDSDDIPESFELQVDEESVEAVAVAWAAYQISLGRPTACVVLGGGRLEGPVRVVSDYGDIKIWFVSDDECYRSFVRWLIACCSRNTHEMECYASSAFPNLIFLEGVFGGIKSMAKGYLELREPITRHLSVFSDYGCEIFSGDRAKISARFGAFGVDISNENGNTRQDADAVAARKRIYNGEELEFFWHSKIERHQNRIHICPDKVFELGKIVVGVFCLHLK
ncbi:hypothetical protein Q8W96_18210 [Pseudomonas aeruginosa]|uniref:hypothetical protein n=1 Tax=Pseudomonas aeruginosa TaxID=287 RepID=UPI000F52A692|nr:hypothetical protein [Pseudomonas aeruginosa]MDG3701146.1 hypothetical protein [Pseudomonas aeruginosa]MDU0714275.1 hypothetical protein [Pseudomonas aeruginosa]HBN9623299.1 hypothetical protein [Pseudomonas aeruginosa]